ncbi:hypothetical protein BH11BAC7_BH11BAC7_13000 [soil metagenome]
MFNVKLTMDNEQGKGNAFSSPTIKSFPFGIRREKFLMDIVQIVHRAQDALAALLPFQ